jgi:hypothetical protein
MMYAQFLFLWNQFYYQCYLKDPYSILLMINHDLNVLSLFLL